MPYVTPDGRYIVVRGRLGRAANPHLPEDRRHAFVSALMTARREVRQARRAGDVAAEAVAHARVNAAKVQLGERGPVWWEDGEPDLNRHLARNTTYADWWAPLDASAKAP